MADLPSKIVAFELIGKCQLGKLQLYLGKYLLARVIISHSCGQAQSPHRPMLPDLVINVSSRRY